MDKVEAIKAAKAIKTVEDNNQHALAINVCNELAKYSGDKEADKQFDRITTVLATLHSPA